MKSIGTPVDDMQFQKGQGHSYACAISAQEGIIEKHTGIDYGRAILVDEAKDCGWYTRSGTYYRNIGDTLEKHGVHNRRMTILAREDIGEALGAEGILKQELGQKHDVIAIVDMGRLYGGETKHESHALWVTGVDTDDDGNIVRVHVNDSNSGRRRYYDAETFFSAWNLGGEGEGNFGQYMMVATTADEKMTESQFNDSVTEVETNQGDTVNGDTAGSLVEDKSGGSDEDTGHGKPVVSPVASALAESLEEVGYEPDEVKEMLGDIEVNPDRAEFYSSLAGMEVDWSDNENDREHGEEGGIDDGIADRHLFAHEAGEIADDMEEQTPDLDQLRNQLTMQLVDEGHSYQDVEEALDQDPTLLQEYADGTVDLFNVGHRVQEMQDAEATEMDESDSDAARESEGELYGGPDGGPEPDGVVGEWEDTPRNGEPDDLIVHEAGELADDMEEQTPDLDQLRDELMTQLVGEGHSYEHVEQVLDQDPTLLQEYADGTADLIDVGNRVQEWQGAEAEEAAEYYADAQHAESESDLYGEPDPQYEHGGEVASREEDDSLPYGELDDWTEDSTIEDELYGLAESVESSDADMDSEEWFESYTEPGTEETGEVGGDNDAGWEWSECTEEPSSPEYDEGGSHFQDTGYEYQDYSDYQDYQDWNDYSDWNDYQDWSDYHDWNDWQDYRDWSDYHDWNDYYSDWSDWNDYGGGW